MNRREARKVSELEKTIDLLEAMDDEQLQAMQVVAKILVFKKPADHPFFRKLTEAEFFEEVDASIAEADSGKLEDTEIMEARLAEKYGLVI